MQLLLATLGFAVILSDCVAFVKIDVSKSVRNLSTTVEPAVSAGAPTAPLTTARPTQSVPQTTTTPKVGPLLTSKAPASSVATLTTPTPPQLTSMKPDANNATSTANVSVPMHVWPTHPKGAANKRLNTPTNYFCTCDLTINLCDLNCCCDIDCTDAMLQVFECTEDHTTIYDYDYESGLHSCNVRLSLFCVVPRTESKVQETIAVDLTSVSGHHRWPSVFSDRISIESDERETYRFGDVILVFDELAEEIRNFAVPYAPTGDFCSMHEPIKFLNAETSTCLRSHDEHQSFVTDYQARLQNTKVLAMRHGVGNHAMMMEYCGSSMAISSTENAFDEPLLQHPKCLPINIFECIESTTMICHAFNDTDNYEIADHLQNHRIVVNFVHNFTSIMNVSALFIYEDGSTVRKHRTMEIRFRQANETMHGHRVSGNLGYRHGKPVIATHYVARNASESDNLILDYFHSNHTGNDMLKLPSFRQNMCRLDNHTFETIDFGHDAYVRCDVRLDGDNVVAATNFTQVCGGFQQKINHFIMHSVQMKANGTAEIATVVSKFGNPVNESSDWLAIESNVYSRIADEPVVGDYDSDVSETEFTCRNMVLSVRYAFVYAVMRVGEVRRQSVIRNVRVELGTRLDLKFHLGEEMVVPVFVDVMFFDVTVCSTATTVIDGFAIWLMIFVGWLQQKNI